MKLIGLMLLYVLAIDLNYDNHSNIIVELLKLLLVQNYA